MQVLRETLDKYEQNEIYLSFNGGKDCTVLLHLFGELFSERYPDVKLFCLYIQPNDPFDEIELFIGDCQRRYNIEIETIRGSVKGALFQMCQQHPQLKACVMGCRRTDPYCNDLNDFQVRCFYITFNALQLLANRTSLTQSYISFFTDNRSRMATVNAS